LERRRCIGEAERHHQELDSNRPWCVRNTVFSTSSGNISTWW
jgi:hypothetical protein